MSSAFYSIVIKLNGQLVVVLAIAAILFSVPASAGTIEEGDERPFETFAVGAVPLNIQALRRIEQRPRPESRGSDFTCSPRFKAGFRDGSLRDIPDGFHLTLPCLGSLRC